MIRFREYMGACLMFFCFYAAGNLTLAFMDSDLKFFRIFNIPGLLLATLFVREGVHASFPLPVVYLTIYFLVNILIYGFLLALLLKAVKRGRNASRAN